MLVLFLLCHVISIKKAKIWHAHKWSLIREMYKYILASTNDCKLQEVYPLCVGDTDKNFASCCHEKAKKFPLYEG